jgi:exonuclease III
MNSPGTLLTWNVAGRTTLLDEQVERVLARDPDVLCLQEVTPATLPRWSAHLKRAGYHVAASALQPDTRRRLGVLVAGRLPFTCEEPLAAAPWPERLLAADLPLPDWAQTLHVVCLHAPIRKNPHQAKILTFEAVSASLAALDDGCRRSCAAISTRHSTRRATGPSRRLVSPPKALFAVASVYGKTAPNG